MVTIQPGSLFFFLSFVIFWGKKLKQTSIFQAILKSVKNTLLLDIVFTPGHFMSDIYLIS